MSVNFGHCSREFVITVIVITEFDCTLVNLNWRERKSGLSNDLSSLRINNLFSKLTNHCIL